MTTVSKQNVVCVPNRGAAVYGGVQASYINETWTPPKSSGTAVVQVTPGIASHFLTKIGKQRALKTRLVTRISADIVEGRWVYDGTPITFDVNGNLINGQHRLHAIVAAGKAVPCRVEWGVPVEAFAVTDSGIVRSNADTLGIAGAANATSLAAAIKLALKWNPETGLESKDRAISNKEVMDGYVKHPDIVDCAGFVIGHNDIRRLQPPSVTTFLLSLFRKKDASMADAFFLDIGLGADLSVGDPRFAYRRFMEQCKTRRRIRTHDTPFLVACGIKAWNAHRMGTTTMLIRYTTSEAFPLPV